jgi:hypothetical protein
MHKFTYENVLKFTYKSLFISMIIFALFSYSCDSHNRCRTSDIEQLNTGMTILQCSVL